MLIEAIFSLMVADALPGKPTVADIMADAPEAAWVTPDPDDLLYIETEAGRMVVLMVPDMAPGHAAQMRTLAREAYYDGLSFYRVPIGFVAQGGDQTGERDKGSAAETLTAEYEAPWADVPAFAPLGHYDGYAPAAGFVAGLPAGYDPDTDTAWLAHCQGAFASGREEGRDSASTEFYITLQPQRYLDRNLTVLGRVIWGQEHLAGIKRNAPNNSGVMEEGEPTEIVSVRLASDMDEAERTPVQIMDTNTKTFAALIGARAARPSSFFYHRPNHVDLCQMPVPVRLAE